MDKENEAEKEMNITFLIGNGFDIGIGLKTRYEDFYERYCIIDEDDSDNIIDFKETLKKRNQSQTSRIIDWSDFEFAFGKHSSDFVFEAKRLYTERFENFVAEFNAYLENEETNIDYTDEDAIAEMMETALDTYYHIRNGDRVEIQRTYNLFKDRKIYNFVSFNYTRSIDNFAEILAQRLHGDYTRDIGRIVHIHGYVDENMIMGVDNATQITNTAFSEDVDIVNEIVKSQQNTDAKSMYEDDFISIIDKSNIICIYGMSIGPTDAKWWDIISKWLSGNSSRRLIILKYDRNYNPRFIYTQTRIINDIMNSFLSHSSLSDDIKEEIKSQIHIGVNHNVFSLNLRKSALKSKNAAVVLSGATV